MSALDSQYANEQKQGGNSLCFTENGLDFELDRGDGLGLLSYSAFEPEVLSALRRFVRPGMKVVDAGAHIGYFSLQIARLVGECGRVHAFEPERENLRLLRLNIANNKLNNITVHPLALGERDNTALLHLSEYNSGMHRLYDSLCCGGESIQVPVRKLETIFSPGEIDVLKLDIEGFEPFALAGARSLIQYQHMVIISEYCPPAMLEAGASISEYLSMLRRENYLVSDAEGLPVPWVEIQTDAHKWEGFGRAKLREVCASKTNPEIAAICQQIAWDLGCTRRYIENLVFMPRKPNT